MPGFPLPVLGAGCHLSEAPGLDAFWRLLMEGRSAVRAATAADWGTDPAPLLDPGRTRADGIHSAFAAFAPSLEGAMGALPRDLGWPLAAARQALDEAGPGSGAACGLLLGHYAWAVTPATIAAAEPVHNRMLEQGLGALHPGLSLADPPVSTDPALADLSSALVGRLAAALGLEGPAFALDAACATFLYALKLAAWMIAAGRVERMLVVAANGSDALFLAHSLSVVHALPAGGRSRPMMPGSDGMTVGEGAVAVLVGRPAVAGTRPWAMLRGIGLSSDGRGMGLTAPNSKGQWRAVERAYAESGVQAEEIGFVECHATGTALGDEAEQALLARLFGGAVPPVGLAKANVGHTMTASGGVGLIKVLLALRHGVVPPNVEGRCEAVPWPARPGAIRRAAVNAFGFGGTNAHLLVEEAGMQPGDIALLPEAPAMAVVGLAACFGAGAGTDGFAAALHRGVPVRRPLPPDRWRGADRDPGLLVRLGVEGGLAPEGAYLDALQADPLRLRIPPRELARLNPQHTLMLRVADEALRDAGVVPGSRVAVIVAMSMEQDVHRLAARWCSGRRLAEAGVAPAVIAAAEDALHAAPEASDCLGHVGNLIASRIAALWDLSGPAFTVSAGAEGVGHALDLAEAMLAAGEADHVLVGAVELAGGLLNVVARRVAGGAVDAPGDGAGAVVLSAGGERPAYAMVGAGVDGTTRPAGAAAVVGDCGAATAMADLAQAVLAVANRALPGGDGRVPQPWLETAGRVAMRTGRMVVRDSGSEAVRRISPVVLPFLVPLAAAGGDALAALLDGVATRLERGESPGALEAEATAEHDADLPLAACLVGADAAGLVLEARALARRAASCVGGRTNYSTPRGSIVGGAPLGPDGLVAFLFPGLDSLYPGFCQDLPLLADGAVAALAGRFAEPTRLLPEHLLFPTAEMTEAAADALMRAGAAHLQAGPVGAWFGTRVLRDRLHLRPDLAFGHSLGELSMLFSTEAWTLGEEWLDRLDALRPVLERLVLGVGEARLFAIGAADAVAAAVAGVGEVVLVNSPRECVVLGQAEACAAGLAAIGVEVIALPGGFAAHGTRAETERAALAAALTAAVRPPEARLLFGQPGAAWSGAGIADVVARGLARRADFPALARRAWEAGARLFIEPGPGASGTRWLTDSLREAGLPHVALPLTRRGVPEPVQLAQLAAALVAHRRPVPFAALLRRAPPPPPQAMRVVLGGPDLVAALRSISPERAVRVAAPEPVAPAARSELALVAQHHARGHLAFLQQRTATVRALVGGGSVPAVLRRAAPERRIAPAFDEAAILELAEGRASSVFGPEFLPVDDYPRRIRVPGQPFTALSRVVSIEGVRGRFDAGRIVTEYDIPSPAWFAVDGVSASEIAVDGQGVLFLLAWLGADLESRGRRRFRWLDAVATPMGPPPREGDTLRYEIRLVRSFQDGESLILQFESVASVDGRAILRVADCMVGLFTDAELAGSAGIQAHHRAVRAGEALPPWPAQPARGGALDRAALLALTRAGAGAGAGAHAPHAPALRLPPPLLLMLDAVTGVGQDGAAEATFRLDPGHWAVRAHFKDDPVFPGPCMLEGAVQLLKVQALQLGLQRLAGAGARFAPLQGQARRMRFRAQVVPEGQCFVTRSVPVAWGASPEPFIVADVEFGVADRVVGRVEGLGLVLTAGDG